MSTTARILPYHTRREKEAWLAAQQGPQSTLASQSPSDAENEATDFQSAANESPPAAIEDDLVALRSSDVTTRRAAFARLRAVPRTELAEAWAQVRQQTAAPGYELDCLQRLEVEVQAEPLRCKHAVVTVISPGYEGMLHRLLDSWQAAHPKKAHGKAVRWFVFCVDGSYEAMADRSDIIRIRCRSVERLSSAVKGAVYSCARWIEAESIISLESDMLVLNDFEPLWSLLENVHPQTMAGCRPQVQETIDPLRDTLLQQGCPPSDMEFVTGDATADGHFYINGGLLVGTRPAWQEIDRRFCRLAPYSLMFIEGAFRLWFSEEFLLNWILDRLENRVELAPVWNVQLFGPEPHRWVQSERTEQGMRYLKDGQAAKVLHFLTDSRSGDNNRMEQVLSEIDRYGLEGA